MTNSPSSYSTPTGDSSTTDPGTPDTAAIRSDADAAINEVKSVAAKVADEAVQQVDNLASVAKEQVAEAADKFKGLAAEQKDLLADQIGGLAEAMQRVATDLESSGGTSARYARTIADGASSLTSKLRDQDVNQIVSMAQDFSRRQPAAFMGVAALLGFAASRFVMASASRRDDKGSPLADNAYRPTTGGADGTR